MTWTIRITHDGLPCRHGLYADKAMAEMNAALARDLGQTAHVEEA